MSGFKPITIRGATYDFAHLAPIELTIAIGSGDDREEFSVRVSFSCHCFTEELDCEKHTPDYHYHHDGEARAFCHHRYNRSLDLPRIINAIGNKRVYFTWQNNFLLVELIDEAGVETLYTIFFEMKRGKKGDTDVLMRVASAYDKQAVPKKAPSIKFHTLVAKTARGEKPTPPPPQRIKRK